MSTTSTESAMSIRREHLHRRGVRLEWFTVSWNVIEAIVAIGAGLIAGSTALIAFGVDSLIEVIFAVVLLWRLLQTGPNATVEEHSYAERRALYQRMRLLTPVCERRDKRAPDLPPSRATPLYKRC